MAQAQPLACCLLFDLTPVTLHLILWYQHLSFTCLSCYPVTLQLVCAATLYHFTSPTAHCLALPYFSTLTTPIIHLRKLVVKSVGLAFLTSCLKPEVVSLNCLEDNFTWKDTFFQISQINEASPYFINYLNHWINNPIIHKELCRL